MEITRALVAAVDLSVLDRLSTLGFSARSLHNARRGQEALTVRQARILLEGGFASTVSLPPAIQSLAMALLTAGVRESERAA
jgi:hypothetical protein